MDLFPGLPDDMGLECLARVPYSDFPSVSSVCRSWRRQLDLPVFWRRRKGSGRSRWLLVLAQNRTGPDQKPNPNKSPVCRLVVCEPEMGSWAELPLPPSHPDGLPLFCRLAGVGPRLVVVGGLDPSSWAASARVLVYDFRAAKWREGARMPGPARSMFACSSDSRRRVLVAGGHDADKRALRSVLAYDSERDEWASLPDMSVERDEPAGARGPGGEGGDFVVIGGYPTGEQGRFGTGAERLDGVTGRWGPVEECFLESGACVVGGGGEEDGRGVLVAVRGGEVAVREDSGWQVVGELPEEVRRTVAYVAAWGRKKVVVIGSGELGGQYRTYLLDLERGKWEKVEVGDDFCGHVQAGCCLEL